MFRSWRAYRWWVAGSGGLVAAITAAEQGANVQLFEAHARLGGRWRISDPPFAFHEGPHVIYADGPLYPWLRQRGLLGRTRSVPLAGLRRFGFRYGGRRRSVPPLALLRVLTARRAPVEASFSEWATARFGPRAAAVAAAAAGVGLFHPQPGDCRRPSSTSDYAACSPCRRRPATARAAGAAW